jgi:hypothetical protein
MSADQYRQVLPDLELSIERHTENVPPDGHWYLLRRGETMGCFRSLKAAQAAWNEIVSESGWKPKTRELNLSDIHRREQIERWSRNRAG